MQHVTAYVSNMCAPHSRQAGMEAPPQSLSAGRFNEHVAAHLRSLKSSRQAGR
jgi:hypothetical protein